MNGIHDMGGMDGFGPVEFEAGEPVFHHPWERTVFGIFTAVFLARIGNAHAYRHGIERMDPAHYLRAPYYERMLTGIATMLVERGAVDRAALDARVPGGFTLARPLHPAAAAVADARRAAAGPDAAPSGGDATPRFAIGDSVRVRNVQTHGHTRCPRYVRGRRGVVVRIDRPFSLPDVEAHSADIVREPTYGVRFEARELWGADGGARDAIHVDLWESYLEPDAEGRRRPRPARRAHAKGKP